MKVLIVDDSALMRRWLKQCMDEIGADVELARNGEDALQRIVKFDPDVITLDINMPVMDGLTCLSHIMVDHPRPVVMLSSLTKKGAIATLEALELGAVDYFEKPDGTVSHALRSKFTEIQQKVNIANRATLKKNDKRGSLAKIPTHNNETNRISNKSQISLIMIGASTGGPGAIEEVLSGLRKDFMTPILVALHMPNRFVGPFTERLKQRLALNIRPLDRAVDLIQGQIIVAGSDTDVTLGKRGQQYFAKQAPLDSQRTWHPSIDRMVESAMTLYASEELLTVQLTGMGNDGATAMANLKQAGGCTVAESSETAVIFGMPNELIKKDGASHVLPSHEIGGFLDRMTRDCNSIVFERHK